jgi:hypothetical protein
MPADAEAVEDTAVADVIQKDKSQTHNLAPPTRPAEH